MAAAIELSEMRVDYEDFTAVAGLNLSISEGEIFGLVGPNGAGKTSTFNVLATLLEPTYGEVKLCGIDIKESPREARRHREGAVVRALLLGGATVVAATAHVQADGARWLGVAGPRCLVADCIDPAACPGCGLLLPLLLGYEWTHIRL